VAEGLDRGWDWGSGEGFELAEVGLEGGWEGGVVGEVGVLSLAICFGERLWETRGRDRK
jgi:hypothetical protein